MRQRPDRRPPARAHELAGEAEASGGAPQAAVTPPPAPGAPPPAPRAPPPAAVAPPPAPGAHPGSTDSRAHRRPRGGHRLRTPPNAGRSADFPQADRRRRVRLGRSSRPAGGVGCFGTVVGKDLRGEWSWDCSAG
ncbi:hypothetical protein EIL87_12625 [Saccharopolyspora rhizosphaerae]|uniref:Uncharacterized protein n=1 Tax=Saccharopolyspora rhizosphaerae TaxID=2492662 RepID=A0A426JTY4_9PSEU|nr:hypothetical protein EIL87_12625 [Saccharopolyspora rhizosphaerae]